VEAIEGVVQRYAWGSPTAIPELLGTDADGGPQAELWFGAHPSAPGRVGPRTLTELVAADPEGALGRPVLERFGARLPFLLKVLAAAQPLSLQAHPSASRAAAGFAAENAAGVPLDAPHRRYRDADHKPELLCALSPFDALCGFRPIEATVTLLDHLGLSGHPAFAPAAAGDLGATVALLLSAAARDREEMAAAIADAAAGADSPEAAWAHRIAVTHPGDPGVGVALLLNLVRLEPGEAIFLPSGNLHAYLEGVGVEIMASSDNVLRGGLTPKHVDVAELLAVLDVVPGPPPVVHPRRDGPFTRYDAPVEEFALALVDVSAAPATVPGGLPRLVLCLEGETALQTGDDELCLRRGAAAWVPASDGALSLSGAGRAVVASTP